MNYIKNLVRICYHKIKHPKAKIAGTAIVSLDCKLGEYVRIFGNTHLGTCSISSYTYIGTGCDFARTNIGSFCSVGPEVLCGFGSHPLDYASTYPGFYTNKVSGTKWFGTLHDFMQIDKKSVEIGSDVWIGARATIKGGIKIGHGAVIGTGAVVTKDVPPYAVIGGVPGKILRFRFDEAVIEKLLASKWWELSENQLREVSKYINDPRRFILEVDRIR